ncbi:MAG: branched-chain-amino-acid transaminase [Gammaproteobacteria bacterium]|jgi:branched-chain amino acid aminotransferase|nr:branched-chain-amino-acid transaminase [Gammaproteobacteria bacterium]MDP6150886.1 branched-chain-amino-acid transaminase [Gammaproteobacteria bacterium]MDP7093171.1 branched-chain-amino-acid transaminase [Gammaproteobacteria bacterium]MDP7297303.1 branched-chain-amino-acid transaminase [Gammaproteobacteria bacterium]MDP7418330.1 branched-chain-amino-acid transaminase [Gammaproteobacteria bacterium]
MWQPKLIMMNGELVPFDEAGLHPLSLAVTYAATVFEGLRAYQTPDNEQFSLFRLAEHIRRLQAGMKLLRFDGTYETDYLRDCLTRLIYANEPDGDVYIRLLVYIEGAGLMSTTGPVGFTAAAMPRTRPKLGDTGLSLGVSSWQRLSDNACPPRIKSTANYLNARLVSHQAKADGYDGALMLTPQGKVSEAPIACFFMVRDGQLITPDRSSNILESITRDTILTRYRELTGSRVEERIVDRSELYLADEAFLCGTGQEILPVTSIDRLPVGNGTIGPITEQLRQDYFAIVRGSVPDHPEWRTLI